MCKAFCPLLTHLSMYNWLSILGYFSYHYSQVLLSFQSFQKDCFKGWAVAPQCPACAKDSRLYDWEKRHGHNFKYMQSKIVVSAQMEGRQGCPGGALRRWKWSREFAHKGENGICRILQWSLAERENTKKRQNLTQFGKSISSLKPAKSFCLWNRKGNQNEMRPYVYLATDR